MATFKAGQRVRIVWVGWPDIAYAIGCEVTILRVLATPTAEGGEYEITSPPGPHALSVWVGPARAFAPLTDPGADAFIERIKKLKPYDEPVVVKTKERA